MNLYLYHSICIFMTGRFILVRNSGNYSRKQGNPQTKSMFRWESHLQNEEFSSTPCWQTLKSITRK